MHAGLECGVIGEKYPGMQMISFGPHIVDVHSPSERSNLVGCTVLLLADRTSGTPVAPALRAHCRQMRVSRSGQFAGASSGKAPRRH